MTVISSISDVWVESKTRMANKYLWGFGGLHLKVEICDLELLTLIFLLLLTLIFDKIVKSPGDLKKEIIIPILLKFILVKENNRRKYYYKCDICIWREIRMYPNGSRLVKWALCCSFWGPGSLALWPWDNLLGCNLHICEMMSMAWIIAVVSFISKTQCLA